VVGHDPSPLVVSDSPHLMLIMISPGSAGSRWHSLASRTNWASRRAARSWVRRSPWPSIQNPSTGLPDAAMPSTTRAVQFGSMPTTTAAATFGFAPVPISVRKVSSRSSPNCSRP
jgi:hypothetical protein